MAVLLSLFALALFLLAPLLPYGVIEGDGTTTEIGAWAREVCATGQQDPPDLDPVTRSIGIGGWFLVAGLVLFVAAAVVAKRKGTPAAGS